MSTSAIAAFQVSQYQQAKKIFTSNSCLIFYVCVFLMDLGYTSYVWDLHRVLTNWTYLYQRKVRIPPSPRTQSWVHRFDCDVLKLHGFHLHIDLHCQGDIIRVTNPNQSYRTFYMQSRRLLIIPWVNVNSIIR